MGDSSWGEANLYFSPTNLGKTLKLVSQVVGLQQCVKCVFYVRIECLVLNVIVGKRGVERRKCFLSVLLIKMMIAQNSKVCWLLCLEALFGWSSRAWLGNGGMVSQERELLAPISDEILQKEVTERSFCQLGIQSLMNTTFCFCHCATVALALGRLRLMWPSDQDLFGALVLYWASWSVARMYLTGSH